RWVRNDAEILLSNEAKSNELALDIEPGQSLNGEPLKLEALDSSGQVLLRKDLSRRETVRLRLASLTTGSGEFSTIRLHSLNGGRPVAGDARILNFRVFQIAFQAAAANPASPNDVTAADDV